MRFGNLVEIKEKFHKNFIIMIISFIHIKLKKPLKKKIKTKYYKKFNFKEIKIH